MSLPFDPITNIDKTHETLSFPFLVIDFGTRLVLIYVYVWGLLYMIIHPFFQLQVESVKRIFERHPDLALEFRAKNQNMRTSCINVLLNLIDTMCQSLQNLSIDDLGQAEKAVTYLKDSGFKVDWLEQKLEEVKEKKMEEHIGETRMQELEEDLTVFKQKCSDIEALLQKDKEELKDSKNKCSEIEALLEKEKAKVLAARAPPLTLDDLVCLMT